MAVGLLPEPVPVRATVWLPAVVLSKTFRVAVRVPLAVGVKVMVTRQVAFALMVPEVGQVLAELMAKSPGSAPVRVMLLMLRATVVLVSVSVEDCPALVVPMVWEAKVKVAGRSVAVARAAAAPVPVRLTVCGLPVALSVTLSVAVRVPVAVGVKVMVTRQVALALMVPDVGQVLAELIAKSPGSVPVRVMLLMLRATVLLVSVSVED